MSRRGGRAGQRGATTLAVLGAALAQGQGVADATFPPPPAECHDMTLTFANVTSSSYDVVVTAVVTRPGIFQLGDGHAYFGTSETAPDPNGVVMTSTATIITPQPGTDEHWTASCIGGHAEGVVHVPAAPVPPTVTVHGPSSVRASSHRGARDPLYATARDIAGRTTLAHCTPALLPLTPSRTKVTCSARDAAGRVGTASRTVTVLGAAAQLAQLRDSLGTSHLRNLVESARVAVVKRDGPAASRRLGLVLDALPTSGLRGQRVTDVRNDVVRIAHVLNRAIPLVHAVRPGETAWSVVADALQHKTGTAPDAHAIALGLRLVLAANPGALDRYGVLHPGTVLTLPL